MPANADPQRRNLSRREMLEWSGLGLAAIGLGLATHAAAAPAETFRFVVVSDIHCRDERCHPWLEKIVAAMRTHRPAFCLINGDLSENGREDQLLAVRRIFATLGSPVHVTIGNHDCLENGDRSVFEHIFPNQANHASEHGGWQFLALDSIQGPHVVNTRIQPETFAWLDRTLPTLDPGKPTVVCTHFPLGADVLCRPLNVPDLLTRFEGRDLRGTFSGHWHGYAERHFEAATVINSRCGCWWRTNMDTSPEKGYFLCETTPTGDLARHFCVIA